MIGKKFTVGFKEFIENNNIPWKTTPLNELVSEYFEAKNDEIELNSVRIQAFLDMDIKNTN